MKVLGKRMLITGAASGIGRALALAAASRGAELILTDINETGLFETRGKVIRGGGKVLFSQALNVGNFEAVRAFCRETRIACGTPDILANVAGVALFSQIEDMDHRDWEKVLSVNLWGVIHLTECLVPVMIKRKTGHVVNVSSASGLMGLPWHAAYAASKHAMNGMSEALSYDLSKHGVKVTLVCPGAVATPMMDSAGIHGDPKAVEKHKGLFLKMAVTPEKAARAILAGVEEDRFLVFTSADMRVAWFLKRHAPRLYGAAMKALSFALDHILLK